MKENSFLLKTFQVYIFKEIKTNNFNLEKKLFYFQQIDSAIFSFFILSGDEFQESAFFFYDSFINFTYFFLNSITIPNGNLFFLVDSEFFLNSTSIYNIRSGLIYLISSILRMRNVSFINNDELLFQTELKDYISTESRSNLFFVDVNFLNLSFPNSNTVISFYVLNFIFCQAGKYC